MKRIAKRIAVVSTRDMSSATKTTHRISWYVWAWDPTTGASEKLRHASTMRGTWGWDAECTCGWGSHTGGATRGSVERDVWFHKHIDTDGPGLPL